MAIESFGQYLKEKRKAAGLTQVALAKGINKSTMYICNIEKGKNLSPPMQHDICILAEELNLSDDDRVHFFELAAADRATLPPEQIQYINSCEALKSLIRECIKQNIGNSYWEKLINKGTRRKV